MKASKDKKEKRQFVEQGEVTYHSPASTSEHSENTAEAFPGAKALLEGQRVGLVRDGEEIPFAQALQEMFPNHKIVATGSHEENGVLLMVYPHLTESEMGAWNGTYERMAASAGWRE
jgi:hypothetical protein